MNIIAGERYKTFTKESKAMLRGEYGKLPGEVNEEVRAKAGIGPEDVITCRPADPLEPELEKYKEEFKDIAKSEEDVLSLALFPQVAAQVHRRPAISRQPAPEAPAATPTDPNAVRELYVEYKFCISLPFRFLIFHPPKAQSRLDFSKSAATSFI